MVPRVRKLVLGLGIAAIIFVVLLVSIAVMLQPGGGATEKIQKTDRRVYLLGTSPNTDAILEQLRQGTDDIVQVSNLSLLPTNDSQAMLLIDGQWPIGQPNATYTKTAAALIPLILNGTPVVIIDGEDFVIQLAIEGYEISYLSGNGNPNDIGSHGLFYNRTDSFSASFSCFMTASVAGSMEESVVRVYNWGSEMIADPKASDD